MTNSENKSSNNQEIKLENKGENTHRGPCVPGDKRCPDNFRPANSEETKLENNIIENSSQLPDN